MSSNLTVTIASGDSLDVREFHVHEALSTLFDVTLQAVSDNPDIDFESVVGKDAVFSLHGGPAGGKTRGWTGIAAELDLVEVEPSGLSHYHLRIVPKLWLLTERRNHRMFQNKSELDIVEQLLGEWGIDYEKKITQTYKSRKYRVQYGESDFDFMSRMLEDAGITFYFEEKDRASKLVLADAPQSNEERSPAIAFRDEPTAAPDKEHVTAVRIGRKVRPGKYTMRDVDYRRPASFKLMSTAAGASGIEEKLERFHYTPGAFLFESDKAGDTPVADDKSSHRSDEGEGQKLAQKRLAAKRNDALSATFLANVMDLSPGVVMSMLDHPHRALGDGKRLLVIDSQIDGMRDDEWAHHVEVRSADQPHHPEMKTPKPKISGVESATVVGPAGEEIHTDEFGRARVHFHWDRESQMDDNSSCWIPVSQPWGGSGYGGSNLPRVGQEVLVDFLGGDPDRPMITGRVYTNLQKTPYKLPANKTQSGWKSNSSPSTGGYNELMFEDAAGKELLRMQAEKDMHKLVKNDEQSTVGRDRSRLVKRNEDVTIGKNRTKQIGQNERSTVGLNKSTAVGVNRSTQVGAIDSTMVGDTLSMMVSPPGEGGGHGTAVVMKHNKIVLSTPAGASITMEGSTITLSAKKIVVTASGQLDASGKKGAKLSSKSGKVEITGGPNVLINGPGLFAGRVTDSAPDQILRGSSTVFIGGKAFPYDVKRLPNGDIQVGDHITIKGDEQFQDKALERLGTMSNTPTGKAIIDGVENSGHNMTITEFKGDNSFCGPTDWVGATPAGQPVFDGGGNPMLGPDGKQLIGTGTGSDTELQLNPDLTLPNSNDPDNPLPNDAVMAHEMTHGVHQMDGTYDGSPLPGWDTAEERNTILTGHPSEADYTKDIGYPWHRTDHDITWAPN